mgnify:CR=1 FL=1|tara:strand:- start:1170 stop:1430 length:261 start_codon:yes stop_codon:yes gene_type:complete
MKQKIFRLKLFLTKKANNIESVKIQANQNSKISFIKKQFTFPKKDNPYIVVDIGFDEPIEANKIFDFVNNKTIFVSDNQIKKINIY